MKLPTRKNKRFFTLTGDTNSTLLTELLFEPQRTPKLKVISKTEGLSILDKKNIKNLLDSIPDSLSGEVSIALPLSFFETINLTLPVMPKEAIGRALPYHLAKSINQPLDEYIYDWQITRIEQERLKITVYLFPASTFNRVQSELSKKHLEITFFESDVFAAFAFLDLQDRLKKEGATLVVLIWNKNISLAIYENRVLVLVRTVALDKPNTSYSPASEQVPASKPKQVDGAGIVMNRNESGLSMATEDEFEKVLSAPAAPTMDYLDEKEVDSILEGFALLGEKAADEEINKEKNPASGPKEKLIADPFPFDMPPPKRSGSVWSNYVNQINLEIVRTKDYYLSVIQGPMIKQALVGGADEFMAELEGLIPGMKGIKLEPLIQPEESPEIPPLFNAICMGAGTRW